LGKKSKKKACSVRRTDKTYDSIDGEEERYGYKMETGGKLAAAPEKERNTISCTYAEMQAARLKVQTEISEKDLKLHKAGTQNKTNNTLHELGKKTTLNR